MLHLAPPGTPLVTHNTVITATPGTARMDECFAVFICRKIVDGSYACELGMQVSCSAAGKRWEESEFSKKTEKS